MKPYFGGLKDYGLTPAGLDRLGARKVVFSAYLRGLSCPPLLKYPPHERRRRLHEHRRRLHATIDGQYRRLARRFSSAGFRMPRSGWAINGTLPANEMKPLAARSEVQSIFINRIAGLRRKRQTPCERWFCVWGKVAVQVEGQTRGRVTIEDRFVLVKARGTKGAQRRLSREWRDYATPYLNSDGHAVRWKLVGIEDVYELNDDNIDPHGTEVYSRLRHERMKREYRWDLRAIRK